MVLLKCLDHTGGFVGSFTPVASTVGGLLIGLAASTLMYSHGRVAGISGIVGGLLTPRAGDVGWRAVFLLGLAAGGVGLVLLRPDSMAASPASLGTLVLAGLLVGFGTRLGSGCTSGHGVCGLTRMSPRSAVAVATFMAAGMAVATLVQGGM